MTISEAKEKVIKKAEGEVGYHEKKSKKLPWNTAATAAATAWKTY